MSWTVGERKKKSTAGLENIRLINSVLPKFETFKSIFLH